MGWFDWPFLGGLAFVVLCSVGVLVCAVVVDRHYSRLRVAELDKRAAGRAGIYIGTDGSLTIRGGDGSAAGPGASVTIRGNQ